MKFPVCRLALAAALFALTACAPPNAQSAANAVAPQPGPATPAAGSPATLTEGNLTDTAFGPLSPTDKKLLAIVQQTSLREMTTSVWAQDRSTNPAIQEAAQTIITQHKDLE